MGLSLGMLAACVNESPPDLGNPGPPVDSSQHMPDTLPSNWLELAEQAAGGKALHQVVRGDSFFVAVGEKGAIAVSRNGTDWVGVSSSMKGNLSVASGDSGFVVAGSFDPLYVSRDGLQWDSIAYQPRPKGYVAGLLWGGPPGAERYHLATTTGPWVSTDAVNWGPLALPWFASNHSLSGIAWNGKVLAVAGSSSHMMGKTETHETPYVWTSPDGVVWEPGSLPPVWHLAFGARLQSLRWDEATQRFHAVLAGKALVSTDGKTWNETP